METRPRCPSQQFKSTTLRQTLPRRYTPINPFTRSLLRRLFRRMQRRPLQGMMTITTSSLSITSTAALRLSTTTTMTTTLVLLRTATIPTTQRLPPLTAVLLIMTTPIRVAPTTPHLPHIMTTVVAPTIMMIRTTATIPTVVMIEFFVFGF